MKNANATINYSITQTIPVIIEADIIVIGAGPGGLGAAVAAARNGARTVMIERFGFPGGMASAGGVAPFMPNHSNGQPMDRTIYLEWAQAMHKYCPDNQRDDFDVSMNDRSRTFFTKEMAMLATEDLLLDAGVKIYYHHQLFDVCVKDSIIDSVILFSKSGLTAARAKIFIDSTGDGDLATKAGCEYKIGNEDGNCQPMTLCFTISNVDTSRMPDHKTVNQLYCEAKATGEINCPRENMLWFEIAESGIIHFNTTRVIMKSGINGSDLSEAEIEARRQLRQYLTFLRKHISGFENACIHSIAPHIGVRETRRIKGLNYIGIEAFENAQKFPDAIVRVSYPVDIHNPSGTGTVIRHLPKNDWYEIPYGCIVAKDVKNLLIAARSISVDHALHSSMRVMAPVCSIGHAAGTAAAMCVKQDVLPGMLDGRDVRKRLIEAGAFLCQ